MAYGRRHLEYDLKIFGVFLLVVLNFILALLPIGLMIVALIALLKYLGAV